MASRRASGRGRWRCWGDEDDEDDEDDEEEGEEVSGEGLGEEKMELVKEDEDDDEEESVCVVATVSTSGFACSDNNSLIDSGVTRKGL